MRCTYSCDSPDHAMARRKFLAGMAATAAGSMVGGLGFFARPAAARQLEKDQKRIVVFNMHGGLSQLESWDPKPGTETGGPFRAIETSVPGIRISELLPNVARQMHHLCLLRGVNTSEDDHGKGAYLMQTGRRQTPAADYPTLGAVCARAMTPEGSALPGHIVITPGGGGGRGNDSAYLGPGTRASTWATASRRSTPRGPARSPSRWTPPATTSAGGSTTDSSAVDAPRSPRRTPTRTSRRSSS